MILHNINNTLQLRGYQPTSIWGMQVIGYLKKYENATKVFVVVDNTKLRIISGEELAKIEEMVRQSLAEEDGELEILFIICTNDIERDSYLNLKFTCWYVDTREKRIVVYENQPEDLDGIYGALEESIFKIAPKKKINIPWITILLILANIGVFIWLEINGSTTDSLYMLEHGASYWRLEFNNNEYYRFFTSMFMHFGYGHIINNMISLAIVGMFAEKIYGRWIYLLIYLSTGFLASLISSAYNMITDEFVISAGASGAIYGIMGAVIAVMLLNRNSRKEMKERLIAIICVLIYSSITSVGVDDVAHIAGLILGVLIGGVAASFLKLKNKFNSQSEL